MERIGGFARSMVSGTGKQWGADLVVARTLSVPEETLPEFVTRLTGTSRTRPWRVPTVKQALGVPSIQRCVSLISGTTGMLSVQGFQKGSLMDEPPQLIERPNPYETPQAFYGGSAGSMAKHGEIIWWIAARDSDGNPISLINVPVLEVKVEENKDNRLLPHYTWGSKTGTRYSGANRKGAFVHVQYPGGSPLALRGEGPLQLCSAAMSVTVEAQEWAANFYADGGNPSVVIKHAGKLSPTRLDPDTGLPDDENGLNEAERLRAQWVDRAHNVPRVIDQMIESVDYHQPNESGAQMLDARQHQNGDAARMFGVPGSLLEFQQAGSSLTYQNLETEYTKLVRTCLQPLYLEPIEQALSDLLPRQITARFNVKGFLRSDIKTRFEVHQIAIATGIYDAEFAQREEGILPGDVEFAPIPFSPPSAVPRAIAASRGDLRCDGSVSKSGRVELCNALLSKDGTFVGRCRRCKKDYAPAASVELSRPSQPTVTIADGAIRLNVELPAAQVYPAPTNVDVRPTIVGENQLDAITEGMRVLHKDREAMIGVMHEDRAALIGTLDARLAAPKARRMKVERDAQGRITHGFIEDVAEAG